MMRIFYWKLFWIAGTVALCCMAASSHAQKGDESSFRPVRFVNTRTSQQETVPLITRFGTINNRSRQILSRLAGPDQEIARTVLLHPKLLLMLQRVADQFPDRKIEIISGYRLGEKGHSDSHNLARAVDFRVSGIQNEKLYDFIKTLPKCGTGYYPKSNFVHLDIREETTTWVDFFHENTDCQVVTTDEQHSGHPILFISVWNNEKATLELITESGTINNRSRSILSKLASSKEKTTRTALLHPRLLLMLQRVAEEFPDHPFEVISGHRLAEKGFHSYHNFGRAFDFRLNGVDNKELYDFIRTLPDCGTGYYPNSVFVHLDVRDETTTWTDYSGVGEASQYKKP